MKFIDPRKIGFPIDSPEVVEAKMRRLERTMQRDFDKFLRDIERSVR